MRVKFRKAGGYVLSTTILPPACVPNMQLSEAKKQFVSRWLETSTASEAPAGALKQNLPPEGGHTLFVVSVPPKSCKP